MILRLSRFHYENSFNDTASSYWALAVVLLMVWLCYGPPRSLPPNYGWWGCSRQLPTKLSSAMAAHTWDWNQSDGLVLREVLDMHVQRSCVNFA